MQNLLNKGLAKVGQPVWNWMQKSTVERIGGATLIAVIVVIALAVL